MTCSTLESRWCAAITENDLHTLGGLAQECYCAGDSTTTRTAERCGRCGRRTLRVRALVSRLDGGGAVSHAAARCTACGVECGVTGFAHGSRVEWRVDVHPLTLRERLADMVRHAHRLGQAGVTRSTACLRCGDTYTVALHRAGLASYHGAIWCSNCGQHVDAACTVLDDGRVVWLAWLPSAGAGVVT